MFCAPLMSQQVLREARLLPSTDLAVFESGVNRNDLDCHVKEVKPDLDFEFRYQTGYRVQFPVQQLAGKGDRLHIIMRVTPSDRPEDSQYLEDFITVPPIGADVKGEGQVQGRFDVGPGRYKVDWLVRNIAEHVCAAHWEIEAKPEGDLDGLRMALAADQVAAHHQDPFVDQAPLPSDRPRGLHIALLANFSPGERGASAMHPDALRAVVSILRSIVRQPGIGRVDLVAFSAQQAAVVYTAENPTGINFRALGNAVMQVPMGTVDYQQLDDPDHEMKFIAKLISEQLKPGPSQPDAVIVVGPKLDFEERIAGELAPVPGSERRPVYYLNYNDDPVGDPWQDAIGKLVKVYQGIEYSITAPHDLGRALKDMMFHFADR